MRNPKQKGLGAFFWGPSTLAMALAAASLTAPALAQEAQDSAAEEEIVVTGFRASLAGALDVKRSSSGVVDAILAEDIADFPDSNLAEAIQRIPGVSLSRGDSGEGKQITVRGLNAGFTRVRLNGIETNTTTGASDIQGSVTRSRRFDFSVFAAELFNAVEVRKTSAADVEEGSLGATVDLRTGRPFDYDGFTLAGGVQESWNDLHQQTDPRFTGLISNTWGDDRFGALLSVAYSERGVRDEGYTAVDIVRADTNRTAGSNLGFCSPIGFTPFTTPSANNNIAQSPLDNAATGTDAANCSTGNPRLTGQTAIDAFNDVFTRFDPAAPNNAGSGAFHPRIPRYLRSVTEYDRLGVTGALQWRPTDRTELTYNAMYGEFGVIRYDNYIQAISFGRDVGQGGKPHTSIVDAEFAPDGSWVYGEFTGVDLRSESVKDEFTTFFSQHVLELEHEFADNFRVSALLGRSYSDHNSPQRATFQLDVRNQDFSWDFRGNNNVPLLTYGFDVADPTQYEYATRLADGQVRGAHVILTRTVKYVFETAELDLEWDISDNFTLRGGLSSRNNLYEADEWGVVTTFPSVNYFTSVPLSSLMHQVDFGRNFDDLPAGAPRTWAAVDYDRIQQAVPYLSRTGDYALNSGGFRTVDENITAYYLQGDFNFDLADITFRGDVGVRYVETETESGGITTFNNVREFTVVPVSNEETLPSLNVAAELTDDLIVRFSAAKVMARPEFGDTAPGATGNFTTTFVINVGAPDLEPIRATTYDLQAEWYFAKGALLSLGLFYKDIETYIQGLTENIPFSETGLSDSLLTGDPATCNLPPATVNLCPASPSTLFRVTHRVNTPGGPLQGFEINYQQPFTFLPGIWRHFGILANYTYVKSDITYFTLAAPDDPNTTIDERGPIKAGLLELSPNAFNGTLYYEDDRLSARISAAYRDQFYRAVLGNSTGSDFSGADENLFIDGAASYNINDQLRLTFEGQNLTDEYQRYWLDSERNDTLYYNHSGRTFMFGLNYRY